MRMLFVSYKKMAKDGKAYDFFLNKCLKIWRLKMTFMLILFFFEANLKNLTHKQIFFNNLFLDDDYEKTD